ncbi:hypothetical protein JW935_07620, partial [candidate division KSB1 bacterium]|nr:hypothetical protein [candidate division KSB1 bacterium]
TKMTVPTAFKHKQGYVRFFAIDELDKIPVNGADIFSLQDVLFDSAFVLPAKGDSLVFHIHITSKSGIKKLTCLCAGDSIPMKRKSEFWYQGSKYFSPAWAGYELPYRFQAVTDKISSSQIFKYYISYGFDTSIEKNTVELTGSEEVLLSAKISNYGGQKAVDIPVAFYRMEDGIFRHLSQDIVTLGPFATGIAKVPFSAEPGVTTIKIQIDPDSVYHDSDRNNNTYITDIEVFRFNYETETGISINGTGRDTLEIDSCFLLNLPAGILAQDCAVQVLPLDTISIHEQPQFKNFPGLHAYSISCQTPLHPEKSFFVRFRTDSLVNEPPETPQPDVNIFRFVEKTGKWLRLSTSRSGSDLMAVTEDFGQFAVLSGTDNIQPKIEFTIDGQPYTPNAYCSKTPQLSIFMQDENGIDISEKTLKLLLNGNTQTVELPDVISNGNQIMLDIYPSLSTGRNQISIQTADCFGNTTKPVEIVLNVAANFDIELLGNYPNPFSRNTTFAYNLTQPCEELWLKIYTASGRLIRHLDPRDFVQDPNPFGADYHELFWDGTDDFGDAVANGVYFFRISAQVTGKTVQKTGKLARIK